jgi:hypothetical protein
MRVKVKGKLSGRGKRTIDYRDEQDLRHAQPWSNAVLDPGLRVSGVRSSVGHDGLLRDRKSDGSSLIDKYLDDQQQ